MAKIYLGNKATNGIGHERDMHYVRANLPYCEQKDLYAVPGGEFVSSVEAPFYISRLNDEMGGMARE